MGIVSRNASLLQDEEAPTATATPPQENGLFTPLARGLRSGAMGLMGAGNATLGGVAEAVGADEFARGRYQASREWQADAQRAAPPITNFRDVRPLEEGGLRRTWDYTTGLVGSSGAMSALGTAGALAAQLHPSTRLLSTGARLARSVAGGAAAVMPFTVGEAIQRQQDDPVIREESALRRLGVAVSTGNRQAVLEAMAPAMLAGRIGAGAATGLRQSVGRNLATIPVEGATEAAGVAVQQGGTNLLNPLRDTSGDTEELLQAGVGGAAAGTAFAGGGLAADAVNARRASSRLETDSPVMPRPSPVLGESPQTSPERPEEGVLVPGGDSIFDRATGAARDAYDAVAARARGMDFDRAAGAAQDVYDAMAARAQGVASTVRQDVENTAPDVRDAYDAVATRARGVASTVRQDVERAAGAARDAYDALATQARGVASTVRQDVENTAPDASALLSDLYGRARRGVDPLMERVARGAETVTAVDLAGLTPEAARAKLEEADAAVRERVRGWGEALRQTAADRLTPEQRLRLDGAMQNLGDKANQTFVAGLAQAQQLRQRGEELVAELSARLRTKKGQRAPVTGREATTDGMTIEGDDLISPRRSDIEAIPAPFRQAIFQRVLPLVEERFPGLLRTEPGAPMDPAKVREADALMGQLGGSLRRVMEDMADGQRVDTQTREQLRELLGDANTARLFTELYDAAALNLDRDREAAFFRGVNELLDDSADRQALESFIAQSVVPEQQDTVTTEDIRELVSGIQRFLLRESSATTPERRRAEEQLLQTEMRRHFGDKTGEVLDQIARYQQRANQLAEDVQRTEDNEGGEIDAYEKHGSDRLEEGDAKLLYYGGGKNQRRHEGGKRVLKYIPSPAAHRAQYGADSQGEAERIIAEVQQRYPNRSVRFMPAEEYAQREGVELPSGAKPRDEGVIVVEGLTDAPERLSRTDVEAMRADARYAQSKSRIDAGEGLVLDARKIVREMEARIPYNESDNRGKPYRQARVFMAGVAAAQEQLGRSFTIADSVEIGGERGSPLTFGRVKEMAQQGSLRPQREGYQADLEKELEDLRKEYAALSAKRAAAATDSERERLNQRRQKIVERGEEIGAMLVETPYRTDDTLIQKFAKETGRQDIGPDEQIHIAEAAGADMARVVDSAGIRIDHRPTAGERKAFTFREVKGEDGRTFSEPIAITANGRRVLDSRGATLEASTVQALRNQGRVLRALAQAELDVRDAVALYRDTAKIPESAPENARKAALAARRDLLRELAAKYKVAPEGLERRPAAATKPAEPEVSARAKKTELVRRARSGDPELIRQINEEGDAKALQRAVQALLAEKGDENTFRVIDALNRRIAALAADPDMAYAMQTKRYSLMKTSYAPTPSSSEGVFVANAENVGPIKRAFIASAKDSDGSYLMKVLDRDIRSDVADATVLTFDFYQNDDGVWEIGVDGPEPDTAAFRMYRDLFKVVTAPDSTEYAKFNAGVFPFQEVRRLLRTFRDHLNALGADTSSISFSRDTGIRASTNGPLRMASEESVRRFSRALGAGGTMSAQQQAEVKAYIDRVLAGRVETELANLPYAGEFIERVGVPDLIRISVNAMDPMGAAYHESLHGFFRQLRKDGQRSVVDDLIHAAGLPHIQKQLRTLLAGEPAALRQLNDAEERAAYAYQFYIAGKLTMNDKAGRTVIQRIMDFFRELTGLWSSEQNAQRIFDYFHSGDYAANIGDRSAVVKVLEANKPEVVKRAQAMSKPLVELAERVAYIGHSPLRDTQVPALIELVDLVKKPLTQAGRDPGYLPAARLARTDWMNRLGQIAAAHPNADLEAALDALQRGDFRQAPQGETRLLARQVNRLLRDMKVYLQEAGVDFGDLGDDYFPRAWDAGYISRHQQDFRNMLDHYKRQGVFKGNVDDVMNTLMATDGSELRIETTRPGMNAAKTRRLDFISAADAAPFLRKDLFTILDTYLTQGTRRAEYARRFGDDGAKLQALLDRAKNEGASTDELARAERYMEGVTGTLGDTISPTARRLMGNAVVYQNIRLLPLALFSSIVDPMGVMVRGGEVSDAWRSFKRGMRELSSGWKKNPQRDGMYAVAEALGVIDNAVLTSALGQLYTQGMVGDRAKKINDAFFKYNLMEQFNTSMRVGATEAALRFLAKHGSGTASPHSARWINELGLARGDIVVLNGRPLFTVKEFMDAGMSQAEATRRSTRVRLAVNQWVDGAVLRPDAADRPVWFNDPHWMLISHLKQFTYSFHQTILKRVAHEAAHGNYLPTYGLLGYVPVMLAADLVKGLIQGGGELPEWKKNWGVVDHVVEAGQRSGLLGVGQYVVDAAENVQRGGYGIGALTGPTIEQMGDIVQTLGGRRQFENTVIDALPANTLYKRWGDETGG